MFSATFYFLGIAGFVMAATVCLTKGRRAGKCVEVNFADLRAASVCLFTTGQSPTWQSLRMTWMKWYARCQEKAMLKQKGLYSWSRTLALCAVLCIVGVLLETEYDKPISVSAILSGLGI